MRPAKRPVAEASLYNSAPFPAPTRNSKRLPMTLDLLKIAQEEQNGDLFKLLDGIYKRSQVQPRGTTDAVIWEGGSFTGGVKPVAHTFTDMFALNGTLMALDGLQGISAVDQADQTARIYAGTKISHLGEPLLQAGLALANQGDIDYQTLAGAVSTGTHGTGVKYGSFSTSMRCPLHEFVPSYTIAPR